MNAKGSPASGSRPLRVLDIYVLVATSEGTLTPLRMKALRLIVDAPPDRWAWGVELGSLPALIRAQPNGYGGKRERKMWQYNETESEAIWCYAGSYRGTVDPRQVK